MIYGPCMVYQNEEEHKFLSGHERTNKSINLPKFTPHHKREKESKEE